MMYRYMYMQLCTGITSIYIFSPSSTCCSKNNVRVRLYIKLTQLIISKQRNSLLNHVEQEESAASLILWQLHASKRHCGCR